MALVPALCFKLDTHDHSWLHSASILAQWKPTPKEHLIFILHLHAVWILLAPAKESSFWFWFFGCLWNSVKFWLPIKEMVACHYQVKLLVSHISTVHASFTQSWVLFPLFLFEKWVGTCMCTHDTVCVWKPEGSHGSQFSFYHLGPSGRLGGDTSPSEPSHWSLLIFFLRKSSHILHWPEAHYVAD